MLESRAQEAAFSRLQAGVSYRSDMEAGLALGRAVADTAITRRALTDGAAASWDPVTQPGRLTGPGFWKPTAPAFAFPPTTPLAGSWRTWLIGSELDYLPTPPPGFTAGPAATIDVSVLLGAARTVVSEVAATRALDAEGQRRRDVVAFWAGAPGDRWNRVALELIRRDQLNLPRAARISALVNVAGADAIDSSWKAKFTYWTARPQTIIQDYIDPTWLSYRPSPADPSYSSGLATVSGGVFEILAFFFPADAQVLGGRADDAMLSRLYDGSHWPHDNQAGYAAGLAMAPRFIARAQADGARPPL